jgi:hypothetical protein
MKNKIYGYRCRCYEKKPVVTKSCAVKISSVVALDATG